MNSYLSDLFGSVLHPLVSQSIIRCCSHPLKSTVEQQLEDVEPDLPEDKAKSLLAIGKTITYENYIPLWKSILSVISLKVRCPFPHHPSIDAMQFL